MFDFILGGAYNLCYGAPKMALDLKTQVFLFRSCINGIYFFRMELRPASRNFLKPDTVPFEKKSKILPGLQFFYIIFEHCEKWLLC